MARILVVDDESNIRLMVRIALQAASHQVETAGDGLEALDKFGDGSAFDLVLLDQRMPGLEGLQVLEAMRGRDPAARVVMVTAFGTIDLAAQAIRSGASNFLRKPFTTDALRAAVLSALDQQPALPALPAGAAPAVPAAHARPSPVGAASINGLRIVASGHAPGGLRSGVQDGIQDGVQDGGSVRHSFTVRGAAGEQSCEVILPAYFVELVKAHADRESIPDAEHFWLWLCEEALANHLWQNAELPASGVLEVAELSTGLRRWVDAVLSP